VSEPPDYTGQYNTALDPMREVQFQNWMQQRSQQTGRPAANDLYDYDMRGAWLSGVSPDPETGHLPDTFKKPNHPTFSNQSQYSTDATPGGQWMQQGDGWAFQPSTTNLQSYGAAGLRDYFQRVEPGNTLAFAEPFAPPSLNQILMPRVTP
jgi:hypothetical protein